MESYLFMECCDCGTTEIFLDINVDKFTILHHSHWMGYIGPTWFKYEGHLDPSTPSIGYITSVQFMIQPRSEQLRVGDPYVVPPSVIKVEFTKFAEKRLTDNALMPDPTKMETHLGMGDINMGNGANYNTSYQMEMKFITSSQSTVKFTPHKNSQELILRPDGQFLDKIINELKSINYVQMGKFDGDVYKEQDTDGKVYLCFQRSDFTRMLHYQSSSKSLI